MLETSLASVLAVLSLKKEKKKRKCHAHSKRKKENAEELNNANIYLVLDVLRRAMQHKERVEKESQTETSWCMCC